MSTKIDISCILKDHFGTMRNERNGAFDWGDGFIFIALPILMGLFAFYAGVSLDDDAIAIMITAASIFSGLLINVLVLIYSINQKVDNNDNAPKEKIDLEKDFLKEIFANLSFSILISLFVIFCLSLLIFSPHWLDKALIAVIIALSVNFILTVLMALKRIHLLLNEKFKV